MLFSGSTLDVLGMSGSFTASGMFGRIGEMARPACDWLGMTGVSPVGTSILHDYTPRGEGTARRQRPAPIQYIISPRMKAPVRGTWGVVFPVTGLRKIVAGWNGDEERSEGLFTTENASSAGEVRGCRAFKGWHILMPSYLGSTRGLRSAQMGNFGKKTEVRTMHGFP